jgi:uncharacterized protein
MRESKTLDPHKLDVLVFAKDGARLEGRHGLHAMPRLAGLLASADGPPARWHLSGALHRVAGAEPEARLHMQASANLRLTCQRCLEPFDAPLAVDRRFRFVRNETEAEALDEQSDDEDVLALPPRLDVLQLLEDELILALPIVPMHETCPVGAVAPAASTPAEEGGGRPNPFAALAVLKKPPAAH